MVTAAIEPTFTAWRTKARALLAAGVAPADITWTDVTRESSLFAEAPDCEGTAPSAARTPRVPAEYLSLAENVCAHRDPARFAVLYRLLHRLTHGGQPHLLRVPTDPDVAQCRAWAKAVSRDIHKMHAFVRFRLLGTDPATGREQFLAWFEPEHRIVRLAAPFFAKRFAGMDWAILTPDECVSWDGSDLVFSPGASRHDVPAADAHDDLWRTYYRSIFNPARLKLRAMQSEMPRKYWKNLPEAPLIADLTAASSHRVDRMLETPARPPHRRRTTKREAE